MIASGKLDRRLTILTSSVGRDSFGESVSTWTPTAETWAERLEVRTLDAQKAALQQREVSARARIRYRTDLKVGQRVELDGTSFTVTGIEPQGRRASLILTLAEVE